MTDGAPESLTSDQNGSAPFGPANGWAAALLAKLDEELLEVEAAQDQARDAGRWRQYDTLCGQKIGLIQAKRWLKETQPNNRI